MTDFDLGDESVANCGVCWQGHLYFGEELASSPGPSGRVNCSQLASSECIYVRRPGILGVCSQGCLIFSCFKVEISIMC